MSTTHVDCLGLIVGSDYCQFNDLWDLRHKDGTGLPIKHIFSLAILWYSLNTRSQPLFQITFRGVYEDVFPLR